MQKLPASARKSLRKDNRSAYTVALSLFFITIPFVTPAQTNPPKKDSKDYKAGVLSVAYFVESANNSINSLTSLLKKDNYRNKITTLNNPANSELGFNLKTEILSALAPMMEKTQKTDTKKFSDVIGNLMSNPEENNLNPVARYLPTVGLFSAVLSLVGNLVIREKKITKEDLSKFTANIQQYFSQYEKLNTINTQFSIQVSILLERSEEIKSDLKDFLLECIGTMNRNTTRLVLKEMSLEALAQKYYDPQKLQHWLDTCKARPDGYIYPPDAPTSVKMLTSSIKKLQKDFEEMYSNNYTALKELILSLKNTIPDLDQNQLSKTSNEIERLYNDSRQADVVNLNITLVDERMNTVCSIINTGK